MSNKCKPISTSTPGNGRGNMPSTSKRPVLPPATEGDTSIVYPFSKEEYRNVVALLQDNKAAGKNYVFGGATKEYRSQSPGGNSKGLSTISLVCQSYKLGERILNRLAPTIELYLI